MNVKQARPGTLELTVGGLAAGMRRSAKQVRRTLPINDGCHSPCPPPHTVGMSALLQAAFLSLSLLSSERPQKSLSSSEHTVAFPAPPSKHFCTLSSAPTVRTGTAAAHSLLPPSCGSRDRTQVCQAYEASLMRQAVCPLRHHSSQALDILISVSYLKCSQKSTSKYV